MRRISHDLAGLSQRINKLSDHLESEARQVSEVWRDDIGRNFMQQHIYEVGPQLRLLVADLNMITEEFESIARELHDPENV